MTESYFLMFSLWNTGISSFDQQVAVEDLVFNVGYSSPLPMAVSAALIGNWQTDFVIDLNAQGK